MALGRHSGKNYDRSFRSFVKERHSKKLAEMRSLNKKERNRLFAIWRPSPNIIVQVLGDGERGAIISRLSHYVMMKLLLIDDMVTPIDLLKQSIELTKVVLSDWILMRSLARSSTIQLIWPRFLGKVKNVISWPEVFVFSRSYFK